MIMGCIKNFKFGVANDSQQKYQPQMNPEFWCLVIVHEEVL